MMSKSTAASSEKAEPVQDEADNLGAVRIAKQVLSTIIELTSLKVPGVAGIAKVNKWLPGMLGGNEFQNQGINIVVKDNSVAADIYLVVSSGVNMVEVGSAVQKAVGLAIEHIVGMTVQEINVYIHDVY